MHDKLLRSTFNRFDTQKNGCISLSDLRSVIGQTFDGEQTEKLLNDADISHDGKISYEEWLDALHLPCPHETHAEVAAKLIDTAVVEKPDDAHRHKFMKARNVTQALEDAAKAVSAEAKQVERAMSDKIAKLEKKAIQKEKSCCTVQ